MTFLETALQLASRGFYVFPLKPRDKWPIVAGGFKAATRDPEQIALWWKRTPDANIGIACEASNLCVVDCDHGFTCFEDLVAWSERNGLPATYAVRSGRRPEFGVQLYYHGAISGMRFELDGVRGDIKSIGGLVVAPPSIHPDSGEAYSILCNAVMQDTPDLIRQLKKVTEQRQAAQTDGLITEGRNTDMVSLIGKLRHQTRIDEQGCLAAMLATNESRYADPMSEDEIKAIVSKQYRLYPTTPDSEPTISIGTKVTVESAIEVVEELAHALKAVPLPKYPVEVFENTPYLDFARRAAKDTFVPLEFYIEGAMTYAAAVAANYLHGTRDEVESPRLYTVLIGPPGRGKGTTFKRMRGFIPVTRRYSAVSEKTMPPPCSVLMCSVASENGLNDALLQRHSVILDIEELDVLFEKTSIQGSGGSLLSILRTCFDDTEPRISTCKGRNKVADTAFLSLLGAITPSLWRRAMEGKDSYGSGLGGRFNLVATNETRIAHSLESLDVGDLHDQMEQRFAILDSETLTIPTTPDALAVLNEWWRDNFKGQDHYNRVNVILHRKALNLAWVRGLPTVNAEIMRGALKLGEYLVGVRDVFAVTKGEDKTAIGENRVFHILRQIQPKAVRASQLVELLDGEMSRASVFRALKTLVDSGEAEQHAVKDETVKKPYAVFRLSLK